MAWVVRTVDATNVTRLKHALTPTPFLHAAWDSYKALWDSSVAKIRKAFDPQEPNKRFPPGFALPQKESTQETESDKSKSKNHAAPTLSQNSSQWARMLPPLPVPGEDYANASRAFKKRLAKNWHKGINLEPPRGTILVSGLVEVHGPKGLCLVDVRAAYEPRNSQWVALACGFRRVKDRFQKPKG